VSRARLRFTALALVVVTGASLLAACSSSGTSASNTLNIIGGSELSDMKPILDAAQNATGVKVVFSYTGSLDGADKIASGTNADAAWFGSNKYIALAGASNKVLEQHNIMLSPVIIGVRRSVAQRLGWTPDNVTWRDIVHAAGTGQFHFAMTSPTASNSGFSALVGVADALSNGNALTSSSIDSNVKGLQQFLAGQALTSGSSGFLVSAYEKDQDKLDGIVNYESVLLGMNASGALHEQLELLYPKEGIVTADYPLMLLNNSKRKAFDKLVAYLTLSDVQRQIQQVTARRAAVPGVPADPRLQHALLIEATFPANLDVVQSLLEDYQDKLRRPASTIYVLDTSGSMYGDRINNLKAALNGLAGADTSFSGHFTRFNPREKVTLVVFSDHISDTQSFDIDSTDPSSPVLTRFRDYVNNLQADGGTAIYSALQQAYIIAGHEVQTDPSAYVSVVLLTDGENNAGISADQFLAQAKTSPAGLANVRIFTVLFGEASPQALQQIADATGGQVFDARKGVLSDVFKEIRGFQ
jgi:Ca-activated chloride channel family protein